MAVSNTQLLEDLKGSSQNYSNFEIYTGRKNKMYTLWYCGGTGPDVFIQNLSIDWDKAVQRANEIIGADVFSSDYEPRRETGEIVYGEDVLRFGKYIDQRISEIDDAKYLRWLANGGQVLEWNKYTNQEEWMPTFFNQAQIDLCNARLVDMGELVEFRGKFVAPAYRDKVLAREAARADELDGHWGEHGSRIRNVPMQMLFETDFEGFYGTTYLRIFMDENNQKFTYMGSKWMHCEKGMWFDVTATLEHGEYKGNPQTKIKRPVFTPRFSDESDIQNHYRG